MITEVENAYIESAKLMFTALRLYHEKHPDDLEALKDAILDIKDAMSAHIIITQTLRDLDVLEEVLKIRQLRENHS